MSAKDGLRLTYLLRNGSSRGEVGATWSVDGFPHWPGETSNNISVVVGWGFVCETDSQFSDRG